MYFIYKPEGVEPTRWKFEPSKLMSPEVEAIEDHTGMAFKQWFEAFEQGSFKAIHGLLWIMLKRSRPTLLWHEVQFCMDDIDFEVEPGDEDDSDDEDPKEA